MHNLSITFTACDCDDNYSTGNCAEGTGQCECRKEFKSPYCDECSYGYFGYPDCKPCICNLNGTDGDICEPIDNYVNIFFSYVIKIDSFTEFSKIFIVSVQVEL